MKKAPFITFEGGEGSGKTTLISFVSQELTKRSIPHLVTREPGGSPLGEEIRNLLLQKKRKISSLAEVGLFLASRAQHVEETILPALEKGKWVLCDRFSDSTIAYQGGARGLQIDKIAMLCQFFAKELEPDFTFYLDIDPAVGIKRAKSRGPEDRIESEALFFHQKIREEYLKLYQANPKRIHLLDALLPKEEVFQRALHTLSPYLK